MSHAALVSPSDRPVKFPVTSIFAPAAGPYPHEITGILYADPVAPVPLAIDGLDPNTLALVLQFAGASPMAVGVFMGLFVMGRTIAAAVKLAIEGKADAGIRAILGLTMAIKNATQQTMLVTPIPQDRRPRKPKTGSLPVVPQ